VARNEDTSNQIYTDGSKKEQVVGYGAVRFKGSEMFDILKFKLDNKSSNNQEENLALHKALVKLKG